MATSKKILVVDDDTRLVESIQDFLVPHGYAVHGIADGRHVVETIRKIEPGIVLLDVMMPDEDGFSVLQRLRAFSGIPVIMLTARGEEADRVVGLELGADDYLAKPFSPRELLARIKAVMRRTSSMTGVAAAQRESASAAPLYVAFKGDFVEQDGFSLNARNQELSKGGVSAKLSTAEYSLLFTLITHPGQVLTREQLQLLAFSKDDYVSERNIDVHISRIRTALRKLGDRPERVRTVWGTGYCWMQGS
ncbi:response regulator transcription factor [Desulfovibrio sp. OttesenSCG-928-O18]|nr:response regulator transcription factor [Desulfovibrio sp. OttesenSCG-928-O18]